MGFLALEAQATVHVVAFDARVAVELVRARRAAVAQYVLAVDALHAARYVVVARFTLFSVDISYGKEYGHKDTNAREYTKAHVFFKSGLLRQFDSLLKIYAFIPLVLQIVEFHAALNDIQTK